MEPSYAPINEKVDTAVKQYVDAIIEYITTINPDIDYDLNYDETTNGANTEKASIADIHTKNGFVTIFPDFMHDSAKASLLNRRKPQLYNILKLYFSFLLILRFMISILKFG